MLIKWQQRRSPLYNTVNKTCAQLSRVSRARKHARDLKQPRSQQTLKPNVSAHFTISLDYLSVCLLDNNPLRVYSHARLLSHSYVQLSG